MEIINTILYILGALALLMLLVFVHELGHFSVGRLFKFKIAEFSLGMGPKLIHKQVKDTDYSIRLFPIGGMCRFYGEDEDISGADSFNAKPPLKRLAVVLGGPVFNLVFAFIFAIITLLAFGDVMIGVKDFTFENSPAQIAGMQPDDAIIAINGKTINFAFEVTDMIEKADPSALNVTVRRGGEDVDLTVRDIYNAEQGRNLIGINTKNIRVDYGFIGAVGHSAGYIAATVRETFSVFGRMITEGVQPGDVGGPVMVVSVLVDAIRSGWELIFRIGVLICISLAIMNLLPLPALDGGRAVFLIIEAIRKKPVPARIEGAVHMVGFILLIGLVILISVGDVITLFGG